MGIAEGEAIAKQQPLDADDRQGHHAVHHRAQDVLAAHHAAIEQRHPGTISKTKPVDMSIHAVSPLTIFSAAASVGFWSPAAGGMSAAGYSRSQKREELWQ